MPKTEKQKQQNDFSAVIPGDEVTTEHRWYTSTKLRVQKVTRVTRTMFEVQETGMKGSKPPVPLRLRKLDGREPGKSSLSGSHTVALRYAMPADHAEVERQQLDSRARRALEALKVREAGYSSELALQIIGFCEANKMRPVKVPFEDAGLDGDPGLEPDDHDTRPIDYTKSTGG